MTEILNKDGKPVNFEYDDEVAQLLLESVPDPVMRSILFNTRLDREVTAENLVIGGYGIVTTMKRILNMAYVIVLTRWKQLKDDKWAYPEDKNYFENSRFTKLFLSAIAGEDITLDLQIFSLMELWVDLKEAPDHVSKKFAMIFDNDIIGDNIGLTLQAVRNAIKNTSFTRNSGTDSNVGKYNKKYCNELCYKLLSSFLIFCGASVRYPEDNRTDDPEDFAIFYKLDFRNSVTLYPNTVFGKEKFIASRQQLDLMNGQTDVPKPKRLPMYIRTETTTFEGKLQNCYNSFDGEGQIFHKTELTRPAECSDDSSRDIHETRKFLSFSYKNIREFAMIINDSIKGVPAQRRALFNICKEKYPKIIADIKSWEAPNIYWDNIITLMMLEMGVSDFLEKILVEETRFFSVLDNIAWRYKGRSSLGDLKKMYRDAVDALDAQRASKFTEKERKTYDGQVLKVRVNTVLKAMNFNIEDDDSKNAFLESLTYKYERVVACIGKLQDTQNGSMLEMNKNVNELKKIFSDIFMFLQVFYAGLDSYAQKRIELDAGADPLVEAQTAQENAGEENRLGSPDAEDKEDDAKVKRRARLQREACNEEFQKAGARKLEEIKKQSLTKLFEGFCDMCMRYNDFSEGGFNISEEGKRLKYLITRNYICDANKLKRFATVRDEDGVTIFDVLDNLSNYAEEPDYAKWLTYLQDIFMFLIYNDDYNARGLWARKGDPLKDKDCDPIYPYIVTYYKENVDRDNVKKCTYRVPLPIAGVENEGYVVTLLTDEEYLPRTYFCIPLRYGSSDSWWINPFLIPKNVIRRIGYPEAKGKG